MSHRLLLRFASLLFVVISMCGASSFAGQAKSRFPATSRPVPRLVQAGDELLVVVPEPSGPDGAQTKMREIRANVDASGEIALALYGRIKVSGLSQRKLRTRVRRHLRRWVRGPVSVVVLRRRVKVTVTGCVKRPGPYALEGQATPWEAVQSAGGLTTGGQLNAVTLVRAGKRRRVDLHAWLTRRNSAELPVLVSGDLIFVPAEKGLSVTAKTASSFLDAASLRSRIIVVGAVRNPGVFRRTQAIDVLHALTMAGGARKDADLSQLRLVCRGVSRRVNLLSVLAGHSVPATSQPQEALLLPVGTGVIVYVPSSLSPVALGLSRHVVVLGAVKRPGAKAVGRPLSLIDALALAGGASEQGNAQAVRVVHERPRLTISMTYDIERYAKEGGPVGAVRVEPGDLIYVGFNNHRTVSKVLSAVSSLAVLAAAATLLAGL